jgi:MSHA biogenesis protein MshK
MLTNKKRFISFLFVYGCVVFNSQALTLNDPTRPPGKSEITVLEAAVSNSAISITAVLKKNQVFYAVINNNWLKKGEKVGAWRVTNITNEGVFLKNENEPEARPLKFLVNEKSDFKKQTNDE